MPRKQHDEMRDVCGAKKGGKRAGDEGFCTRIAGWGTDHKGAGPCRDHMGSTEAVASKYRRVLVDKKAQEVLARLDVEPVDNPLEALAVIAGQCVAWKDAMSRKVEDLLGELRYTNKDSTEQLRSEVVLWERALDRCVRVLESMARLNIDERLAQIDEKRAQVVVAAVLATLKDLNLEEETLREARNRVGRHLRRVAA